MVIRAYIARVYVLQDQRGYDFQPLSFVLVYLRTDAYGMRLGSIRQTTTDFQAAKSIKC
jgi:hypothetical protein